MPHKLRAFAKRMLPASLTRGLAKSIWEWVKRRQDQAKFRRNHPDVPYVYLSKQEIAQIKGRGYFGQICQDYFLDLMFEQDRGRFIDIGANNPEANSNTLALERRGWTGFAFDPMRSLKDRWAGRSGTTFVNAAISDREELRDFVEIVPRIGWEHQLSSFREFVRAEDLRQYDFIEYKVECAPIAKFVPAGEIFDCVSIDVEGAEALILRGFDFDQAPPRAILLENVSVIGGAETHRQTLMAAGYRLIARLNASDDLFMHRGQTLSPALQRAIEHHSRP